MHRVELAGLADHGGDLLNVAPPSVETCSTMVLLCRVTLKLEYSKNTTPWLSVRSAQNCRPPVTMLLVAADTCRCVQVEPPSVEVATITGSGAELPVLPTLRKATLQAYTWPKNGLVAALSAQTASLSENSAEFCRLTITGATHALLCPPLRRPGCRCGRRRSPQNP